MGNPAGLDNDGWADEIYVSLPQSPYTTAGVGVGGCGGGGAATRNRRDLQQQEDLQSEPVTNRYCYLAHLEVEFLSWIWVRSSGDFLTATSPTVYLVPLLIYANVLRETQTSGCKKITTWVLSLCLGLLSGCKKIAGSLNSNSTEKRRTEFSIC